MDRAAEIERNLAAYLEAVAAGNAPSTAEWIDRHPQFRAELTEFFALRRDIEALASPIRETATPPAMAADSYPVPFGRYTLLRELGRGGMGTVYLAREHTTERVVAMKFLRHAADPAAGARFQAEVRTLARLDHPHIVRVIAVDLDRPDPLFTMEYVPGGSLADRVKADGPLPPAEAARLVATVARAVHSAHEASVLHRDLKPSNILLSADGTPKVSDFGLAKRTDVDEGLTRSSGLVGTPAYMPPEQISKRNGEPGPPSDVYGLGATLYHLLTGRPPFVRDEAVDVIALALVEPPSRPRALRPEIPLGLEAVVVRCLEKDPADRYPTAAALADDLDRFLTGQVPSAPALTRVRRARRWTRRNWHWVAAAVVAVGLVLVGRAVAPTREAGPPTEPSKVGRVAPMPPDSPGTMPAQPAAKPDPVGQVQANLRSGLPATLVGPTGLPAWHAWRLNPVEPVVSPKAGGACSFQTFEAALLELLPDPGVANYRVSAEICHLRGRPEITPDDPSGLDTVGLYFGAVTVPGTSHPLTVLHVVRFCDTPVKRPLKPGKLPEVRLYDAFTLGTTEPATYEVAVREFTPAPRLPGEWRRIVAEVRADSLDVFWGETPTAKLVPLSRRPAGQLQARYTTWVQREVNRTTTGVAVPPWSPRRALGVWCARSEVAVRNVIIEPLSPGGGVSN